MSDIKDLADTDGVHPTRVFLSYGHDEHANVAELLKADLEGRGFEVWYDVERLRPGGDWERYIEEGLDWTSERPQSARFVLLMTPHSVRRPNGYCLNELSRAIKRNIPVIPVMVARCEPPLSIERLQWLDLTNSLPGGPQSERYGAQLERLVDAVKQGNVPFEGAHARLVARLDPDPFDAEFRKHLGGFVGRQWVEKIVDDWVRDSDAERVLWLTGQPGFGKTALCIHLFSRRSDIAAMYLCEHDDSRKSDPHRVIRTIAYQLASYLPDYHDRLNELALEDIVADSNEASLLDRLIVQPLATITAPPAPILTIVDALDETTKSKENALARLIGEKSAGLPPWLRLIVTSRPDEPEVTFWLQRFTPNPLDDMTDDNNRDVRDYVKGVLRSRGSAEPDPSIVEAILAKSEGLFLYVVLWLDAALKQARDQPLTLDRIGQFPQGLAGVYADFFRRHFADPKIFRQTWRPLLEVVAAAFEPISIETVAHIFQWSHYEVDEIPAELGSLFPLSGGKLKAFHRSVLEWMTDATKAGPYLVKTNGGHQKLSDWAWDQYHKFTRPLAPYAVRFLPDHLSALGDTKKLATLLLDPAYVRAKAEVDGYGALCSYYSGPVAQAIDNPRERELFREVSNGLHGLRDFRGRSSETLFVERAITAAIGIAVVGEPRLGKTMFLRHLWMRDFRARVFISIEEARWTRELIDSRWLVAKVLARLGHLGLDEPEPHDEHTMYRFFDKAAAAILEAGITILLLDDFPDDRRMDVLLHMLTDRGLRCVVTGRKSNSLSMSRHWHHFHLEPLSREDMKSWLEELFASYPGLNAEVRERMVEEVLPHCRTPHDVQTLKKLLEG